MAQTPDLVASAEAAAILRCDRTTLVRWVKAGRLSPAMQLPGPTGAKLFHRADVEALAATLRDRALAKWSA